MSFFPTKRKQRDYLVLDIGSEAIKALILRRKEQGYSVLASALEYFDDHNFFVFDKEKIVSEAISRVFEELDFKILPREILLGLNSFILKGKVVSSFVRRKNPQNLIYEKEAKLIQGEALAEARDKISDFMFDEKGILPQDICFTYLKVLEIKIDGYQVPSLLGYRGKDIIFRILVIFSLKESIDKIEKIIRSFKFKEIKLLHPVQGLIKLQLAGKENCFFLDIGGNDTQVFLMRNSKLEQIENFEIGGKNFSQEIMEILGQRISYCRELKEKYSAGKINIENQNELGRILDRVKINWYKKLKDLILKISQLGLLPSVFYLFGGGSKLPEIQMALQENDWQGINFTGNVRANIFSLKDFNYYIPLENKDLFFPVLNNPQYVPIFLIFYARENF